MDVLGIEIDAFVFDSHVNVQYDKSRKPKQSFSGKILLDINWFLSKIIHILYSS